MSTFQIVRLTDFYQSKEWKRLRKWALSKYGSKCMSCGSTEDIQVDHIKPTSLYWRLRLKKWNVQILCKKCNLKKSNVYIDDLRPLRSRIKFIVIRWLRRAFWLSVLIGCGVLLSALFFPSSAYSSFLLAPGSLLSKCLNHL